ncbi:MAG: translation initiation factor IF-2 associated domain-containing protein, partial [Xanthobacteraceae bacterium]
MTETTKNSGEKLSVTPTKTLTLKRAGVEQGVVRQSFSHGRSKAVVVEKVKRRVAGPGEVKAEPAAPAPDRSAAPKRAGAPAKPIAAAVAPATAAPAIAPKASGVVLRTLTDDERNARAHALADARLRETEERERAEEEARVRRTREESERVDRAAAEARKLNEEVRRKHDEETKRKADEVAKK